MNPTPRSPAPDVRARLAERIRNLTRVAASVNFDRDLSMFYARWEGMPEAEIAATAEVDVSAVQTVVAELERDLDPEDIDTAEGLVTTGPSWVRLWPRTRGWR